jgi:hypothetical protein
LRRKFFQGKTPSRVGSFFFSLSSGAFPAHRILSFFLGFFLTNGRLLMGVQTLGGVLGSFLASNLLDHRVTLRGFKLSEPLPLGGLAFVLFQTRPHVGGGPGSLSLGHLLSALSVEISLSYRVAFIGLSRRLRKIVKNKYKYRRQYVCVLPSARLRYGLHLVKFCLKFIEGRTQTQRLAAALVPIFLKQDTSPFLFVRRQQQKHVLGALRKQYLLS